MRATKVPIKSTSGFIRFLTKRQIYQRLWASTSVIWPYLVNKWYRKIRLLCVARGRGHVCTSVAVGGCKRKTCTASATSFCIGWASSFISWYTHSGCQQLWSPKRGHSMKLLMQSTRTTAEALTNHKGATSTFLLYASRWQSYRSRWFASSFTAPCLATRRATCWRYNVSLSPRTHPNSSSK